MPRRTYWLRSTSCVLEIQRWLRREMYRQEQETSPVEDSVIKVLPGRFLIPKEVWSILRFRIIKAVTTWDPLQRVVQKVRIHMNRSSQLASDSLEGNLSRLLERRWMPTIVIRGYRTIIRPWATQRQKMDPLADCPQRAEARLAAAQTTSQIRTSNIPMSNRKYPVLELVGALFQKCPMDPSNHRKAKRISRSLVKESSVMNSWGSKSPQSLTNSNNQTRTCKMPWSTWKLRYLSSSLNRFCISSSSKYTPSNS